MNKIDLYNEDIRNYWQESNNIKDLIKEKRQRLSKIAKKINYLKNIEHLLKEYKNKLGKSCIFELLLIISGIIFISTNFPPGVIVISIGCFTILQYQRKVRKKFKSTFQSMIQNIQKLYPEIDSKNLETNYLEQIQTESKNWDLNYLILIDLITEHNLIKEKLNTLTLKYNQEELLKKCDQIFKENINTKRELPPLVLTEKEEIIDSVPKIDYVNREEKGLARKLKKD